MSTQSAAPSPLLHRSLVPSLTILFVVLLVLACGGSTLDASPLDKEAQSVDRSLICPVCPGETLDQSQVQLAKQMRVIVREKLAQGWTKEQIQDFFVERYGPSVLAAPPQGGFNTLAWVVPPVGMLFGVVALWFALRNLRRLSARQPACATVEEENELGPYLAQIDAAFNPTLDQRKSDDEETNGS